MTATPRDFLDTFSTAHGERVLEALMGEFAKSPFAAGQPDQTAYNCGTKAVLEHILAMKAKAEQG